MRILYIVNTFPSEKNPDHDTFVKSQIDSIRDIGNDVTIINTNGTISRLNYAKTLRSVRKIMRDNHFDIVHGHYVYSGWMAALQKKAPSVVSFMGSDLYGTYTLNGRLSLQGKLDVMLSKYLQRYVDGIVVKSNAMLSLIKHKDKAIVLPNGVDFNVFTDKPLGKARRDLGLSPKKIYILFAGHRESPRKGYAIAEQAVKLLKAEDPRYELLVASGLPHSKVPLYMNASNLLVLPSRREGSPNVVKEALACNLPVIATDVGDVKERVGEIPGCRIVGRTSEDFASAVRDVVNSKSEFTARESIKHLRIEYIARQLLGFYGRILDNQQNRRT